MLRSKIPPASTRWPSALVRPWRKGETGRGAPTASLRGLDTTMDRGIGLVSLHSAVSSLRDYPRWLNALGGTRVPDAPWRPARTSISIDVSSAHPVGADVGTMSSFRPLIRSIRTSIAVMVSLYLHNTVTMTGRIHSSGLDATEQTGQSLAHSGTMSRCVFLQLFRSAVLWHSTPKDASQCRRESPGPANAQKHSTT